MWRRSGVIELKGQAIVAFVTLNRDTLPARCCVTYCRLEDLSVLIRLRRFEQQQAGEEE